MLLPRMHLVELEDSPRLPRVLRDLMTEYLRWVMETAGPYDRAAAPLAALFRHTGMRAVVDLASGGAGPWVRLLPAVEAALGEPIRVMLTDLHPNHVAFARAERESHGRIRGHAAPVDATAVSSVLDGARTIFTGLHHLRPDQVRALLRDTVAQRRSFAAFELTDRSVVGILTMFASLALVLASSVLIRPFRLQRVLLTWLVPVLPLCIVWDGVVSALRSYTPDELRAFAADVATTGYTWEVGHLTAWPARMPVTYLTGRPV
jgi:hypothetical protein